MKNAMLGSLVTLLLVAALVSTFHKQIYNAYRLYRGIEAGERTIKKIEGWRPRVFGEECAVCPECHGTGKVPTWITTKSGAKVRGSDATCWACRGFGHVPQQGDTSEETE